ncbi:hypothetical protein VKT23_014503 [Stygiomarasmius scandens]|uniref:Taste receptor type 2 n=1 Tax=Marasmiellus scandens TaxID=2682957 RepID=A0ABR1J3E9_9AGAR
MVYDSPSISPPATITLFFVSLLYGIHFIVFPTAVCVLLRRRLSRSVLAMLAAVTFMFCMSTILTVTLFVSTILDGTIFGIYFNQNTVRSRILMWPRNMNLICADAVVVWRMLVLYPNRYIRYFMCLFLLGFSALAIFNSIGEPRDGPFEQAVLRGNIATLLSFATNLIATSAISCKAWQFRQLGLQVKRDSTITQSEPLKLVNGALMLLVESGLLYLGWQLLAAIVSQVSNNCDPKASSCLSTQFAANTLIESTTITAGLYPTLTMVIIALRQSIADGLGLSDKAADYHMEYAERKSINTLSGDYHDFGSKSLSCTPVLDISNRAQQV